MSSRDHNWVGAAGKFQPAECSQLDLCRAGRKSLNHSGMSNSALELSKMDCNHYESLHRTHLKS